MLLGEEKDLTSSSNIGIGKNLTECVLMKNKFYNMGMCDLMKRKNAFSICLITVLCMSTNSLAKSGCSSKNNPQHKALDAIETNHQAEHKEIFATAYKNPAKIDNKTVSRAFKNHVVGVDADLKTDVILGKSLELFSDERYDSYLFSLFTMDLALHAKQYNIVDEPKYHLKAALRTKNIVGNSGNFSLFRPKPLKLGIGRTENELAPTSDYMMTWFREAWLEYSFNEKYHSSLKFGFMPFQVGQGIALGNAHRLGRIVPGLDRTYDVDQYRMGLQLSGDFSPDRLGYNFYLGVINRDSTSFYDTAQMNQAQNLDARHKPYRGEFVNNTVAVAQLIFRPSIKDTNVTIKPYLILNRDTEQQVEYQGDARSIMGIIGYEANINKGKLTINLESGLNFGYQDVKGWDRDMVLFASKPYHLYMFQDFGEPGTPVWRTAERTTYPEDLSFSQCNGAVFRDEADSGIRYKNAYNRFRHPYKNHYTGFFVTADASYEYVHSDEASTTIGVSSGFINGDDHPNDNFEELIARRLDGTCTDECTGCFQNCWQDHKYKDRNKNYSGFVGLQQLYTGKTVRSFFMMEAHKLNQPITTDETMVTYPQMTNLAFLGLGGTYKQRAFDRVFDVNVNGLMFCSPFKEQKGFNYGLDTFFKLNACGEQETLRLLPFMKADAEIELSRFLGIELNGSAYFQYDPSLRFYAQAAMFIPGLYYEDAQGKIIRLTEQFKLASTDYSGYEMDNQKYRYDLGKSTALLINVGFEYHFSS